MKRSSTREVSGALTLSRLGLADPIVCIRYTVNRQLISGMEVSWDDWWDVPAVEFDQSLPTASFMDMQARELTLSMLADPLSIFCHDSQTSNFKKFSTCGLSARARWLRASLQTLIEFRCRDLPGPIWVRSNNNNNWYRL